MKKLLLISFAILMVVGGCDITSLNRNTKQPSTAPPGPLFSNAQYEYGGMIHRTNVNIEIFKLWAQQWTSTTYTEEPDYNITDRDIPGNDWAILYENVLNNLESAKKSVQEDKGGLAAVKKNKIASINVMQVLAYSELVNIFGNIPYTEALDGPTPKFDDAKSVYTDLFKRLDTAIGNFDASAAGFGSQDLYYGGDIGKWIKFANSLKMRLAITVADVNSAKAKSAIEEASPNAFMSNADQAMIPFTSSFPHTNPVWNALVRSGRHDYLPAEAFINRMNKLNDPRRPVFFTKKDGAYKGGTYGKQNNYPNYSHASAQVLQKDRPGMILGYDEVEFIRAEAAARGYNVSGTAASHYDKAITADMKYWGVPDSKIAAYMAQPSVAYATASGSFRQKIGLQKWLGLYLSGLQAYTEVRRLDYPMLKAPDQGKAKDIGQLPSRFTYPATEQTRNEANYKAASSAIGGDKLTTKIFWNVRGDY